MAQARCTEGTATTMNEYINRDELKDALLRRGFYPTFVKAVFLDSEEAEAEM